MASNIDKFRGLLRELFQLDQADLDFGIYRIMNQKRDDVVRFLDQDLLPQVQQAFAKYKSSDKATLQTELTKLATTLSDAGMNPDDSPKVKALKQQIAESSVDVAGLENEVFSHLFNFFRRYYEEGDFVSLRRYKEGVYAIPYEGEEVKLHWANADQYYVKSSEYLRDYAFTVGGGKRVHFRLIGANTEKDNNKAASGNERRFVLAEGDDAVAEVGGELIIRFTFRPDEAKRKQAALNDAAEKRIVELAPNQWHVSLIAVRSISTADPKPSILRHHLSQYAARNTFDYFIHKNLGGFLRRELDFYIKNEVMFLDDVLPTEQDTVEQQQAVLAAAQTKMASRLSVIAILRDIAHKIIRFLAQIEDFQKRLWLKKKFVTSTDWLVTVDRLTSDLRDRVAINARQWAAWEELGFKPKEFELGSPKWKTRQYLDANDKLVVDTSFFKEEPSFVNNLLASDSVLGAKSTLDEATTGILFHADNFQCLKLMQERFRRQIKCVYIDPPYNTGNDDFAYKDGYQESSWLSFIAALISSAKSLATPDGIFAASTDAHELLRLTMTCNEIFGEQNRVAQVSVAKGTTTGQDATTFGSSIDYLTIYRSGEHFVPQGIPLDDDDIARFDREDERGKYSVLQLRKTGNADRREDRPNMFFPMVAPNGTEVFPIGPSGYESRWRAGRATVADWTGEALIEWIERPTGWTPYVKYYADGRLKRPSDLWDDVDSDFLLDSIEGNKKATRDLKAGLGKNVRFSNPKPIGLVQRLVSITGLTDGDFVLDFFAGSGTTAHAILNENRKAGEKRFILAEVGDHFDTVLKPRITKVIYSPDWKDGESTRHGKGVSVLVKVVRLEGYEDTLNNLRLVRTAEQSDLLSKHKEMAEEYTLSYLLDTETRSSSSLLNINEFSNPFAYTLEVTTGSASETKPVAVDLVETFNWLLGLRVKHIDHVRGVRVVDGINPQGERVLVLWRNTVETDSEKLNAWFEKQGYSTLDMEYAVVFINGDNNLENLRRADQTWKVRLIEEEFQRLMFDVQDV